jgi:hypothetical protein
VIHFSAILQKFGQQGEKTGWTYVLISADKAEKLKPGNKQSFRVKGKIDGSEISKIALMPMGDGSFIMPVNGTIRKAIRKQKGATVKLDLEADDEPMQPPAELIECLEDEPAALEFYNRLPGAHRNYFTRWIESAKTEPTKAKRIAQAINAFSKGWGFQEMTMAAKADRNPFLK